MTNLTHLQELTALLLERDIEKTEQSDMFGILAEFCPVGIIMTDIDGLCTFVNKAAVEIIGHPDKELIGDKWKNLIYPMDLDETVEKWSDSVETGHDFFHQFRYKNGCEKWVQAYGKRFYNTNSGAKGWVVVIIDIRKYKINMGKPISTEVLV